MSPWVELRNTILVGTDKRRLPEPDAMAPIGASPEVAALHQAALLGARYRAGTPMVHTGGALPADGETPASGDVPAPRSAVKLLELVLAGNVVVQDLTPRLLGHWLAECHRHGRVMAHDLLPPVLERGRQSIELRSAIRPVIGERGRWLAGLNRNWAWAAGGAATPAAGMDVATLLTFSIDGKRDALRQRRSIDADEGRALLEEIIPELTAAQRAACLEAIEEGLGPDDEPMLEAALDDRSKKVRAVAARLLDGLPDSRRARRMADRLAPLAAGGGRFRKGLTVAFPDPPTDDELRDLREATAASSNIGRGGGIPVSGTTAESAWLLSMVAGAPLSWWEEITGATPADILKRSITPEPELIAGWTMAATAQRSGPWAEALLAAGHVHHRLIDIAGEDAMVGLVRRLPKAKKHADFNLPMRITARSGQWGEPLSHALVDWTASVDLDKTGFPFEAAFAQGLHPSVAPKIERLLPKVEDHQQRKLRRILQVLTMHTNITEAFQDQ